eukprot:14777756-Ditylum_brightwellii.AAC.1
MDLFKESRLLFPTSNTLSAQMVGKMGKFTVMARNASQIVTALQDDAGEFTEDVSLRRTGITIVMKTQIATQVTVPGDGGDIIR